MIFIRYACLILLSFYLCGATQGNYIRHADEEFHFSVNIPPDWKKSVKDLESRRVLTLAYGRYADITVSATKLNDEERAKWETWQEWYAKGFGASLLKIIETRELAVGNGVLCKLLVFEYTRRGEKYLQRAMILMHEDRLLLIACRAPTRYFSRHSGVFDAVMASVDFFEGAETDTGTVTDVVKKAKAGAEPDSRKILQKSKSEKIKPAQKSDTKQPIKKEEKTTPEPDIDAAVEQDPGIFQRLEQDGIIERIK